MTRAALNHNADRIKETFLNEEDKETRKRMEGQNRAEESTSNSRLIHTFPVTFRNIGILVAWSCEAERGSQTVPGDMM